MKEDRALLTANSGNGALSGTGCYVTKRYVTLRLKDGRLMLYIRQLEYLAEHHLSPQRA